MKLEEKISNVIDEQLTKPELREKYLTIIELRIIENKKSLNSILLVMLFSVLAFPLIHEAIISDISIGPFKINDKSFALLIIPSIFSFSYFKYVTIWTEIVKQKNIYKSLTSKVFLLKQNSYLNESIRPFSFLDFLTKHNELEEKSSFLGCIIALFWIPISFFFILFPYGFIYYSLKILFIEKKLNPTIHYTFCYIPIIISILTLITLFQVIRNEIIEQEKLKK